MHTLIIDLIVYADEQPFSFYTMPFKEYCHSIAQTAG